MRGRQGVKKENKEVVVYWKDRYGRPHHKNCAYKNKESIISWIYRTFHFPYDIRWYFVGSAEYKKEKEAYEERMRKKDERLKEMKKNDL